MATNGAHSGSDGISAAGNRWLRFFAARSALAASFWLDTPPPKLGEGPCVLTDVADGKGEERVWLGLGVTGDARGWCTCTPPHCCCCWTPLHPLREREGLKGAAPGRKIDFAPVEFTGAPVGLPPDPRIPSLGVVEEGVSLQSQSSLSS